MKESQRHVDAFEQYFLYKQSGKNTDEAISLVQVESGFSKTSLYKWKKELKWDEREAIRSVDVQQKVEKQTNTTVVENKIRYLGIYHRLLDDLEANLKVKISSVSDVERVIRGALLLQGEDTDRVEQRGGGLDRLSESLRKSLKELPDK